MMLYLYIKSVFFNLITLEKSLNRLIRRESFVKGKDYSDILPDDFMNAVFRLTDTTKRTRVRAIPGGMDSRSSRRY